MKIPGVCAVVASLAASAAVLVLAGCAGVSGVSSAGAASGHGATPSFTGTLHGGQQPISGATVQMYAVGSGGVGSAATPLLNPAVTSSANGSFNVTGLYQCPSASSLVYLVATGGNPGLSTGTNNSGIAMMTLAGTCGSLSSSTYLTMNELTTAAAVFALQPYMTSTTNVGYSGSDAGIAAAFAAGKANVDTATGLPKGSSADQEQIDTIANVLAACVNSSGASSAACSKLFANTNGSTNIAGAALQMATNPSANTQALFSLIVPNAPFSPSAGTAPVSWSTTGLPAAATPTITVTDVDSSTKQVAIATTTPNATIYFTQDGSAPTTKSPVYAGPFNVTASEVVMAAASSATTSLSSTASQTVILAGNNAVGYAPGVSGTAKVFLESGYYAPTVCSGNMPNIEIPSDIMGIVAGRDSGVSVFMQNNQPQPTGYYLNVLCTFSSTGLTGYSTFQPYDLGYAYPGNQTTNSLASAIYAAGGSTGNVTLSNVYGESLVIGSGGTYHTDQYGLANGTNYLLSINQTVAGVPVGFLRNFAVDAAGNVYVCDESNYRILKVTPERVVTVFAGTGVAGQNGDGGSPLFAAMQPTAIAIDGAGTIYVLDDYVSEQGRQSETVRRIKDGKIYTIAGGGTAVPPSIGSLPLGSVDLSGNLGMVVNNAGTQIYLGGGYLVTLLTLSGN